MIHQYPYHVCMQYLHKYVRIQLDDGNEMEGFVANVDQTNVTLAVPTTHAPAHMQYQVHGHMPESRQPFGYFGGFYPGRFFPYPLPLARIGGIFPLGFFI